MGPDPPILAGDELTKRFFGNAVLKAVSIEIRAGRIHALLGENGAGKSTLINLLSGTLRPDGGRIRLDGRDYPALTPRDARRLGIAVVQQELSLAPHLSVAENVVLGSAPVRRGFLDYGRMAREAEAVCRRLGLEAPLDLPVADLPLGQRQLVEIAKALYRRPRVLILDEPTSSLTAHDAGRLFAVLRELRGQGLAILYISHRLNEILALCEYVTVLKDGTRTADQPLEGSDPHALVRLMVGRQVGDLFPAWQPTLRPEAALEVEGLHCRGVRGVDLTVRRGEILGLGGLLGQGQEEALLALYGAIPARAARFAVAGRAGAPGSVVDANRAGMAYVPADRKREGLLLPLSIGFNLTLPSLPGLARRGVRRLARERETIERLSRAFAVRGGDARAAVQRLSGGNQQKIAIAKWLPLSPSLFLLNDPTRGVDIETKREIYLKLRAMAAEGTAILLLSSDTLELVHVCDRVAVFGGGRIAALLEREALSEEAIVGASVGLGAVAPAVPPP
ncbi:MAG: sugar ABC transporter ATP-binding protein [Dongiaceae bacterium]